MHLACSSFSWAAFNSCCHKGKHMSAFHADKAEDSPWINVQGSAFSLGSYTVRFHGGIRSLAIVYFVKSAKELRNRRAPRCCESYVRHPAVQDASTPTSRQRARLGRKAKPRSCLPMGRNALELHLTTQ